jgi:hypothetical protein
MSVIGRVKNFPKMMRVTHEMNKLNKLKLKDEAHKPGFWKDFEENTMKVLSYAYGGQIPEAKLEQARKEIQKLKEQNATGEKVSEEA